MGTGKNLMFLVVTYDMIRTLGFGVFLNSCEGDPSRAHKLCLSLAGEDWIRLFNNLY